MVRKGKNIEHTENNAPVSPVDTETENVAETSQDTEQELTVEEKAALYDMAVKGKGDPTLKAAQKVRLALKAAVESLEGVNIKNAVVVIADNEVTMRRFTLRKRAYVPLSDERREALTEQLAKAREARAASK